MEILKFRAWDKLQNKFLYPYPEGFSILGETTCFDLIGQQLKKFTPNKTTLERLNDVIITQYIGKNDINGKEIYVGDILGYKDTTDETYLNGDVDRIIVEYREDYTRYLATFHSIYGGEGFSADNEYDQLHQYIKDGWCVIGNIFENMNLITGKEL